MAGSKGRSGGRNRKVKTIAAGDGAPTSPRTLAPRAAALFNWLIDKLGADAPDSAWARVDGVTLAALAELLESQERIASLLADDSGSLGLMRMRLQYAAQISRMSAIIGLSPIDRERLPKPPTGDDGDVFNELMERMRNAD